MQNKPGREADCDGERLLALFEKDGAEFIVAHFYEDDEISTPRHGSSRLVVEEFVHLGKTGRKARNINLHLRPGPISRLRRFCDRLIDDDYKHTQNLKNRPGAIRHLRSALGTTWMFLSEFMARVEATLPAGNSRRFIGGNGPALVLFNKSFCVHTISGLLRRRPEVKLAVIEHNIEWRFYQERVGSGILAGLVADLIRWIELDNLRQADYVFCINPKDREVLIDAGLGPDNVFVWLPLGAETRAIPQPAPRKRRQGKSGSFTIGFVGTNYGPNIMAVRTIMQIARELGNAYEFRIFGPVGRAFSQEQGIPDNVTFMGWVDDLAGGLSGCDAFINPKTVSDTGAEVKMFDYLAHAKPIISTPIGARGFEDVPRVSVMETDAMPGAIRKIATGIE